MSPTKMYKRPLKCIVFLEINSVSCPGGLLHRPSSIYFSVCMLGQCRKTACVPPEFPLHFHQKMIFEKIFPGVVDPADVADLLEADTTFFELIQMGPPEGEILATLEERTRAFLYPGPEFKSRRNATTREKLMKRTLSFAGISPKVEFSTTSVIQESGSEDCQPSSPSKGSPPRASTSPGASGKLSLSSKSLSHSCRESPTCFGNKTISKREQELQRLKASNQSQVAAAARSPPGSASPQKLKREARVAVSAEAGYLQPTASSRARALSPYTHRRMCQLSDEASQRLRHLQLGPHLFKKTASIQPPFSVPCLTDAPQVEFPWSSSHDSPQGSVHQRSSAVEEDHTDASLLESLRPHTDRMKSGYMRTPSSRGTFSRHEAHPKSSAASSLSVSKSQIPPAARHFSSKNRFGAELSPSYSEEIHRRVQRILHTHRAAHETSWDF